MPQGEGLQGCITSIGRGAENICPKNMSTVFILCVLTCDSSALCEWISLESLVTDTYGDVASHPACGMDATKTGARVHTSLIFASQLSWTVIVENTFRTAVWRTANHIRLAGAVTAIPLSSWKIRVWTTWVGVAGIFLYNWLHS